MSVVGKSSRYNFNGYPQGGLKSEAFQSFINDTLPQLMCGLLSVNVPSAILVFAKLTILGTREFVISIYLSIYLHLSLSLSPYKYIYMCVCARARIRLFISIYLISVSSYLSVHLSHFSLYLSLPLSSYI